MSSASSLSAGISSLPNQRYKIILDKGINFNMMICGESGTGKTTFINTLLTTIVKEPKDQNKRHCKQLDKTVEIEVTKIEIEEQRFRVNLRIVDTPGFGDYINSYNSWVPVLDYIDNQHENYMRQEQQPDRKEINDMRVHVCFLKQLDIETMKRLGSRVNLIPVIAKADTLTPHDLIAFKKRIRADLDANRIKVYTCPVESEDEQTTQMNKDIMAAMPFSLIGSTQDVTTPDGRTVKGRAYHWGVAEVENEDHCDFGKLRQLLIRSHLSDLIETTGYVHYESYRSREMLTRSFGEPKPVRNKDPKYKEKEELLRKTFADQIKKEESRFRQLESRLFSDRDRLNKDLEIKHAQIKALEAELETLHFRKNYGQIRR
ncbi:hypothetical protein G6F15_004511 [Rhizopus arrhizus]|nr:hypothetical protein G6F15_004511 [Rhizopus arrhizus]